MDSTIQSRRPGTWCCRDRSWSSDRAAGSARFARRAVRRPTAITHSMRRRVATYADAPTSSRPTPKCSAGRHNKPICLIYGRGSINLAQPINSCAQSTGSVMLARSQLRIIIVASLAGLLLGFDTAVISGVTQDLRSAFALTPAGLGITVSTALWGTLLGALTLGRPGDQFGSRAVLKFIGLLYFGAALGCALA